MVAGPHAKTQANMLGRVKVQNECIKKKNEQRTLVTWVLNNPDKCGALSDLIHNGQLDMYINGHINDPKAQKPLLRKCHMWERVANEDQKRVLFNDKHMPSETAKKLARTTIDKNKLWVFLTARKKKGPINSNMTHKELWNLMDNRIFAVGPRSQSLVVEKDHIVWEKCGPWDTSGRTENGQVVVQHRYIDECKAHALDHLFEPCYLIQQVLWKTCAINMFLKHVIC